MNWWLRSYLLFNDLYVRSASKCIYTFKLLFVRTAGAALIALPFKVCGEPGGAAHQLLRVMELLKGCVMKRTEWILVLMVWLSFLISPLSSYVTLGKWLYLTGPEFPYLRKLIPISQRWCED